MLREDFLLSCAEKYGTPMYIFDLDELEERVRKIRKTAGDRASLCYAVKANPFLISRLEPLVERFEVCSPGEMEICGREQVDGGKIVMSGVYKALPEISRVMDDYGESCVYTVESVGQLEAISSLAGEKNLRVSVLLRLSSGNQFGMSREELFFAVAGRERLSHIDFLGIQYFSGTQKKGMGQIEKELLMLEEVCGDLWEQRRFRVRELEYGPGLSVDYFGEQAERGGLEQMQALADLLGRKKRPYHVTLEMGRYIAASCGVYLTRIVDQKRTGEKNFCILDGGIHHLNYFGQVMAMKVPKLRLLRDRPERTEADEEEYTLCGALCTTGDILVKAFKARDSQVGDALAFYNTGAYSVTETGYLFLSRDLPLLLGYSEKGGIEIFRRRLPTSGLNLRESLRENPR